VEYAAKERNGKETREWKSLTEKGEKARTQKLRIGRSQIRIDNKKTTIYKKGRKETKKSLRVNSPKENLSGGKKKSLKTPERGNEGI